MALDRERHVVDSNSCCGRDDDDDVYVFVQVNIAVEILLLLLLLLSAVNKSATIHRT
jgi:hypothetical protein